MYNSTYNWTSQQRVRSCAQSAMFTERYKGNKGGIFKELIFMAFLFGCLVFFVDSFSYSDYLVYFSSDINFWISVSLTSGSLRTLVRSSFIVVELYMCGSVIYLLSGPADVQESLLK